MFTSEDMVSFQADHHPLEHVRFDTIEDYCLYLIHLRAYEEAVRLASGKQVLDLGCNNGYGSAALSSTATSVMGVDVSRSAIAAAQQTHSRGNLAFQVIDGGRLPFDDNSFDMVVSCQVIEHISDTKSFLREIIRVLRPDGSLFLTTPNAEIRLDPGMQPWNKFHVREYSRSRLADELEQFFSKVEVRGLFANPDLYKIERDRVERARNKARRHWNNILPPYWRVRKTAIDFVKGVSPDFALDFLRQQGRASARHSKNDESVPEWRSKYCSSDFFYGDDRMDDALDLLAICKLQK